MEENKGTEKNDLSKVESGIDELVKKATEVQGELSNFNANDQNKSILRFTSVFCKKKVHKFAMKNTQACQPSI